MRNIIISLGIFIFMFVGIIFSYNHINNICKELNGISYALEMDITTSKWEKAYDDSLLLLNRWEKHSKMVSVYLNDTEIDCLSDEIIKLTQYIKCYNKDESLASTHLIKYMLTHIKNSQEINLQNIF